jgi:hypothetical protein
MLKLCCVAVALALIAPTAASAKFGVDVSSDPVMVTETAPGQYSFVQNGFAGGAAVTGTFSGVDTNGDGQISYFTNPPEPAYPLEVTNFDLSFSGNAIVPSFSLTFSQLDNFNYQLGPTLGSGTAVINGLTEGIESGDTDRFYRAGPGPMAPCDGAQACGGVLALPEPEVWVVLLVGLFGVGGAARHRFATSGHRHTAALARFLRTCMRANRRRRLRSAAPARANPDNSNIQSASSGAATV